MILKREDLSKEFKNLYVRMIAYEPKERPSIQEVLNDPWFDEINVLIQYDPEGYKKLENEYKDYMYALELKYKDMIQLEIQNNPNHEQNDGNRGTKGISDFEGEQYFEENLIPKKLGKKKNYKYFAKIKGITNPVKFMNLLMDKIIQKNKDECTLKKYDEMKDYLTRYLKARIPLIIIDTVEKNRALRLIKEVQNENQKNKILVNFFI